MMTDRRRRGYVLVPVIMGLTLLAIAALTLTSESALGTSETSRLVEVAAAEHLARSGLAQASWRAEHGGCEGDFSIASTTLGDGSYSASGNAGGSPTVYNFTVDRDAWIRSDDTDRNNGSTAWNHIRFESGNVEQVLTRFDLSGLPAGVRVHSAVAWFYIKNLKPHPEGEITVHPILADWSELTVTWNSFGSAFGPTRLATIPAQEDSGIWIRINLTAQVQAWANGQPNHGILFASNAEGIHTEYTGRADGSNPPRLEVVAGSVPSSPVSITSTGTARGGTQRQVTHADVVARQLAETAILRPAAGDAKDTYTWDAQETTNYGSDDETWVATGNNNTANALFEFALAAVPAGARILDATLSVHHRNGNDPNVPISAHRIVNSWRENEADWRERRNGRNWNKQGGDFDATPASTTLVGPASGIRYEWDVTPLVEGWIAGDFDNDGLLLRTEEPGIFGERFDTSDHTDPTRHPSLTIRYACECGTPCLAPQSEGTVLLVIGDSPSNPSNSDEVIIAMLKEWGYTVTLIQDDDSSGNYASMVAAADVVLVSESVLSSNVGTKLSYVDKGVVLAEQNLTDNFGIAADDTAPVLDTIEVVDVDHPITSILTAGPVQLLTDAAGIGTTGGTLAPDARILAQAGAEGGLVVIEPGGELFGGGTAPAPRALIPLGAAPWELLTNTGRLLVQRTLDWASGAGTASLPGALMVVANDGSLTSEESAKRSQIEAWGYDVTIIDQDDNQTAFDAALVDQVVVFVSEDVNAASVGNKLVGTTVGVVTEEANLSDEFGFAEEVGWKSGTTLLIEDASHYITEPFSLGPLQVASSGVSLALLDEPESPFLAKLGWYVEDWALAALAAGVKMDGGGTTAGRRVFLPWGGDSMSLSYLNADGLTIFERSLAWAAGAELPATLPLAHWKMDEGSGTTAVDSVGGHDGALLNGPVWTTGTIDGGLAFDGSNDFLNVVHADTLSLSSFSISAWIRADEYSDWQIVLHKGTSANVSNYYLGTYNSMLMMGFFSNVWVEFADIDAGLAPATWYHVAGTYDDTTRRGKLYLNGVEVHSSVAARSPTPNGESIWIGRTGLGEHWPGTLDDVRLYDEPLGPSEIARLYLDSGGAGGGGGGGKPSGPSNPINGGGDCNGTYRDNFDARVWDGSNGSLDWSATPWIETGESDGPASGDVEIETDYSSYQLKVQDNDNGGEGVIRAVDLSGAGSATISFQYRRHKLDNPDDYVTLSISTTGTSGPWTPLDSFVGEADDGAYQTYSRDITSFAGANTAIRLLSSPDLGKGDRVLFDDLQVSCSPGPGS